MLSIIMLCCVCHFAEFHILCYVECHNGERCYAGVIILSIIMLCVIMLCVIMLTDCH
jgi:hypothetical protein